MIATKGRFPITEDPNGHGLSRRHLTAALDASLQRLGVEAIDLDLHGWYPLARRSRRRCGSSTTRHRRARFSTPGLSNFLGYQIQKYVDLADAHGLIRPVTVQPQYNLLARAIEWEVGPACQAEGLGLLPWSPLASGWLTGKYRRGEPPAEGTRLSDQMDQGMRVWNERGHLERTWQVIDAVARSPMAAGPRCHRWRSPGCRAARRFVR